MSGSAIDNNGNTSLQNKTVYMYKGGKINDEERQKMKHVRIDGSATIIDDEAFFECTNLQTVEFSTNHNLLKEISNKSFYGCHNLSSINLQDTQIEMIRNHAFYLCHKLITVHLPSTVRKIGSNCFSNCWKLKTVDLSHVNDLETIEERTFFCCKALTTIKLPSSTSRIGRESFYCCALETLDLQATCIYEIGEGAFRSCENLTSIQFPTTIKHIGKFSFYSCVKLSSLDLQGTCIESIGDYAFHGCYDLTKIHFPKTLEYIGNDSFYFCTKLEYLNLRGTSIRKIGDLAFNNCTNLTTIDGMSSYQEEAPHEIMDGKSFHYGCMELPASLVKIGKGAFYHCPNLKHSIDNNRIHYICDINRGGRRFLLRNHHHHGINNDGDSANECVGNKVYYSSLWPLILYHVMNKMELPKQTICPNDDNLSLYTDADPLQRRASVVFYLLVHGTAADLQPQQPGNGQSSGREGSLDFQKFGRNNKNNTHQCLMM